MITSLYSPHLLLQIDQPLLHRSQLSLVTPQVLLGQLTFFYRRMHRGCSGISKHNYNRDLRDNIALARKHCCLIQKYHHFTTNSYKFIIFHINNKYSGMLPNGWLTAILLISSSSANKTHFFEQCRNCQYWCFLLQGRSLGHFLPTFLSSFSAIVSSVFSYFLLLSSKKWLNITNEYKWT